MVAAKQKKAQKVCSSSSASSLPARIEQFADSADFAFTKESGMERAGPLLRRGKQSSRDTGEEEEEGEEV